MAYQPLALKYRPQKFDDVVGQEVATTTLRNAIAADRISHAYLFSGMRGVGKTTAARIMAKCLNCRAQEGPTTEPCDECESCKEIAAGRSIDVLEIDGASNTSVDDVRDLQENLIYAPARDRYKVYIVDEVHMLSKSAFNAFLKTLEEPPQHVVFIFATTEIHKIPATVLSRCQLFDFGRVSAESIAARLRHICASEGIDADDDAIDLIVFASEGSIRDAISALDQTINFSGDWISYDDALKALGMISRSELRKLIDAVVEQDAEAAFSAIRDVADTGVDMRLFCRQLIRHVRDLMVARVAGSGSSLLPYSDREVELLGEQAQRLSEEEISRLFGILVRADQEMQLASAPQYHLEAAAVKMIHSTRLTPLSEVIAKLQSSGLEGGRVTAAPRPIEQRLEFETPAAPKRPGHAAGGSPRDRLLAAARGSSVHRILDMATSVELDGSRLRINAGSLVNQQLLAKGNKADELKSLAREAFGVGTSVEIYVDNGGNGEPRREEPPLHDEPPLREDYPLSAEDDDLPPADITERATGSGAPPEVEEKVKEHPVGGMLFRAIEGTITNSRDTGNDDKEHEA